MSFRTRFALILTVMSAACSKEPEPSPVAPPIPAFEHADDPAIQQLAAFISIKDMSRGGDMIDTKKKGWRAFVPRPPQVEFTVGKTYVWHLDTNLGKLRIKLFTDVAPMHCSSFLYLTMLGYFDGLNFHRVIKQFMAQGGDPRGDGTGGPGYEMALEVRNDVRHDRPFVVSTANSGPNSDGSQFFIMFRPQPSLDGKYSIFGELMDEGSRATARAMESVGNSNDGPPSREIVIEKASYSVE